MFGAGKGLPEPASRRWTKPPSTPDARTKRALLVVGYPDPEPVAKYKQWLKRQQIDWMMNQPRDELAVQQGFWRGLNNNNLFSDFSQAPPFVAHGVAADTSGNPSAPFKDAGTCAYAAGESRTRSETLPLSGSDVDGAAGFPA